MQDRLTIVRPTALGAALAGAVRTLTARTLDVTPAHLPHLDARLACGDFETVRSLLRNAAAAAALPLFAARYALWSGDLQSVAGVWEIVLASLESLLSDREHRGLRHITCIELASTATDLGDAKLAARLHGIARKHANTGGPVNAVPIATSHVAPNPDADSPAHVDPDASLICNVAFNTLGVEPDAVRGRLRLRPRMDRFDELEAHHIRFADGSVDMSAVVENAAITIRVEQLAGAIPITVLLEPFVHTAAAAEVDGHPADLSTRAEDGVITIPVQLVLDDVRTLVIRTAP